MKTLVDVGAELQALRKSAGKKQGELAVMAGMRQEALSRVERGRSADFSVAKLLRLAHALGLELAIVPAVRRPDLDTVLEERRAGANVGPQSR